MLRCMARADQIHALGGIEKLQQLPLSPIQHPDEELPNLVKFGHSCAQQLLERPSVGMERHSGDDVRMYTELAAANGVLGRFTGAAVMPLVQQFMGR